MKLAPHCYAYVHQVIKNIDLLTFILRQAHTVRYNLLVLRGTTVLPRHRGTIFLRYQYRRLYGTF